MTAHPGKPPRLGGVFQRYDPPLYFVTFNTWKRRPILASPEVQQQIEDFGRRNETRGIAIGRYVIMPDHAHLFLRVAGDNRLAQTIRLLKTSLTAVLRRQGHAPPYWQPGFFDHLLRNSESYAEKWHYIWKNPQVAELVTNPDEWPYQGEVTWIDRV